MARPAARRTRDAGDRREERVFYAIYDDRGRFVTGNAELPGMADAATAPMTSSTIVTSNGAAWPCAKVFVARARGLAPA